MTTRTEKIWSTALLALGISFWASILPNAANADDRVLCALPRLRREEVGREIAIEWAGRHATVEFSQSNGSDLRRLIEEARRQGADAVLLIRLPDGVLGGIEMRYVTLADERERHAILHEAYDAIDARALAIATRDLGRADEEPAQASVDVQTSTTPPATTERALSCAAPEGVREYTEIYGFLGPAWFTPHWNADTSFSGGLGLAMHWAAGHGFRIESEWASGNHYPYANRWNVSPAVAIAYSYRMRENITSWLSLAWSADAGISFMLPTYIVVSSRGYASADSRTFPAVGLELGADGDLLLGNFLLGLGVRWRPSFATAEMPPGMTSFVQLISISARLGFEFTI